MLLALCAMMNMKLWCIFYSSTLGLAGCGIPMGCETCSLSWQVVTFSRGFSIKPTSMVLFSTSVRGPCGQLGIGPCLRESSFPSYPSSLKQCPCCMQLWQLLVVERRVWSDPNCQRILQSWSLMLMVARWRTQVKRVLGALPMTMMALSPLASVAVLEFPTFFMPKSRPCVLASSFVRTWGSGKCFVVLTLFKLSNSCKLQCLTIIGTPTIWRLSRGTFPEIGSVPFRTPSGKAISAQIFWPR